VDLTTVDGHAINLAVELIKERLTAAWATDLRVHRLPPLTTVRYNYDMLYYPEDNASRSPRYSRYVTEDTLLRTHTSAMIPQLLPSVEADDETLLCPGITYRRDVVDRLHTGEPHQMDIWRVSRKTLTQGDLRELIGHVIGAVLGDVEYRTAPATHSYTQQGLEVEVLWKGEWVEVLECGLAHPQVLKDAGLEGYTGLALGVGLDRLVMLRKGVPDIRALRATDPRIADQMKNLDPWVEVSKHPNARRDISVAMDASTTEEDVCEQVVKCLGEDAALLEEVALRSVTLYSDLPPIAHKRLGMVPGQSNLLIRVALRDMAGSIPRQKANDLLTRIYSSLHANEVGYG